MECWRPVVDGILALSRIVVAVVVDVVVDVVDAVVVDFVAVVVVDADRIGDRCPWGRGNGWCVVLL